MKYVIVTLQEMTPEQLKMNPFRPIMKVNPNEELTIDEGESNKDEEEPTKSTELSEQNSTCDIPTEAPEESKPIEISQVTSVFNKSTQDEADSLTVRHVTEFETKENARKIWKKRTSHKASQQIRISKHILLFTSLVLMNGI